MPGPQGRITPSTSTVRTFVAIRGSRARGPGWMLALAAPVLWQVGNPAQGSATGSIIPAQINDIDKDGENETLALLLLGMLAAAATRRRRRRSRSEPGVASERRGSARHGRAAALSLLSLIAGMGCGSSEEATGANAGAPDGIRTATGGTAAAAGGTPGSASGAGLGGRAIGGSVPGAGGTGAVATGGAGTGGPSSGGTATGGLGSGGTGTGGAATGGGTGTGGAATGGGTGGTGTGGTGTGGAASGSGGDGMGTGGATAGGAGTGGSGGNSGAAGGAGTGAGGSGEGVCEVAASCGTHKWACWPMPNPEGTGPRTASYSVSDGVVHDDVTCLDWQQSPSGTYTNSEAHGYCENLTLGGYDDWRVPTRIELVSIIDWTRSPATDPAFSPQGGYHNTGSNWILTIQQRGAGTTCGNGDCAWMCNLSDGMCSNAYGASGAISVRCVRGNGPGEGFDEPAVAPPNQYTLLSEDVARDNYTRLIWQRDGAASGLLSWSDAGSYCDALSLSGYEGWRLPTLRELSTLVDEATVAPAIDTTVFRSTSYGARQTDKWYWTSHLARGSSASWGLNFDDGFTGSNSGSAAWNTFGPSWVKCVHDE